MVLARFKAGWMSAGVAATFFAAAGGALAAPASQQPGASPAPAPPAEHPGMQAPSVPPPKGDPQIRSHVALVIDKALGIPLFAKHEDLVAPIASITKLMTAMVVLDAGLPPEEPLTIDRADVDVLKRTRSRLPVGASIRRGDLLTIALMSSDNRAAAALARTYPGGTPACLEAMNRRALALGMRRTHFADPTGLSSLNVSTAGDLTLLVLASAEYPAIRQATTSSLHRLTLQDGRVLDFRNSNGLVSNPAWSIGLSKTGYINEAGRCLVMQAEIAARQVVIVLLDSWGKYTRLGDANRIRHWLEGSVRQAPGATAGAVPTAAPASSRAPGP